MRFSFSLVALFVFIVLFTPACDTVENAGNSDIELTVPIPFNTLGKGALFGGGQEGFSETEASLHVLKTEEEWQQFEAKMNSVNQITGGFEEYERDFNNEILVAIVDKLRGSGGYEITCTEVSETPTKVIVWVKYSDPPEMAASVLTQPFHIIRIPTTSKPVEWSVSVP